MPGINIIFSTDPRALAKALEKYSAVFVVADRRVCNTIAQPLVESLAERGVALRGMLRIRASEHRKTFRTVEKIHRWLIGAGADRDALILAIGGGVTTDLAGFAACTYKRGVRFAFVPTTILGQCDAAIGGKTGCNIGGYKNMAGVIRQSEFTFINPDYPRSQPWNEFIAGAVEMLKAFIIADPGYYEKAVGVLTALHSDNTPAEEAIAAIPALTERAVAIKSAIVERDEMEKGERAVLNLGHSYAHAIEYKSAHSLFHRGISHGEAVAMGIILAAAESEKEKLAQDGLTDGFRRDFEAVGLPTESPWGVEELREVMKTDKKSTGGNVRLVLIKKIGEVIVK